MALFNMKHSTIMNLFQVSFLCSFRIMIIKSSSINELNFPIFKQYFGCNAIPCCICCFRNYHSFLSKNLIDKRRFSHIWAPYKTYFDCILHFQILNFSSSFGCKRLFWLDEKILKILII